MREVGGTGENPEGKKINRRVIPEGSTVWNHDGSGSVGPEFPLKKKESGSEIISPRSMSSKGIFEESSQSAREIIVGFGKKKDTLPLETLYYLSKLDTQQGNAAAVTESAQILEQQGNASCIDIYANALSLGDVTAYESVRRLLHEQQVKTSDAERYKNRLSLFTPDVIHLRTLVRACAENEIPIDEWVRQFGENEDRRNTLKYEYYHHTKLTNPTKEDGLGIHYRDEITDKFLKGKTTEEFSWKYISEIYDAQDDEEKKGQVFQRLQRIAVDNHSWTSVDFYKFLDVSHKALHDGAVSLDQANWIENAVNYLGEVSRDQDIVRLSQVRLAVSEYRGATSDEILQEIDQIEKENPVLRNTNLWFYANKYAKNGDFDSARRCLSSLSSDRFASNWGRGLLNSLETPEAVATVRPDDMVLSFHEELHTAFTNKAILVSEDTSALKDLVRAETEEPSDVFLFERALGRISSLDKKACKELIAEIAPSLNEDKFRKIVEFQLEVGDTSGLQVLYENVAQEKDPKKKVEKYVDIALIAAKYIEREKSEQ